MLDLPPPSLHDLEREGIELLVERGPSFVINGKLLVTGQIERTTDFEQGLKNQQAEIDGAWQPDPWVYDDQAIVMHVRNKGLVVATGCGHAGVINILQQVRSQTGVEQIYALLGGFHLTGALFEPIIPQTVERFTADQAGGGCACALHRLAGDSTHCPGDARCIYAQ